MKTITLGLVILLAACTRSAPADSATITQPNRPPTDQEIRDYLNKERKAAKATQDSLAAAMVAEGELNRKKAFLERERESLEGYISVKQIEINREQTRLLRKYSDDKVREWTINIGKAQRRIADIEAALSSENPKKIATAAESDAGFDYDEIPAPKMVPAGTPGGTGGGSKSPKVRF